MAKLNAYLLQENLYSGLVQQMTLSSGKKLQNIQQVSSRATQLPLIQPNLATRSWEKLGIDIYIFDFKGLKYLMIVDH